jgi:CTP synthase
MTKYIVVVGGVISGVGKGIATASIGKIMQEFGFSVTAIKIDPYINYDAGTLRPTEHGEVWVTEDGGEIDQDLGNYERFLNLPIPKKNNLTTGQVYKAVIDRERRGEYLGETVQLIPHVTNEIKHRIREASKDFDIALIEVGGTVGDYENTPFLFALQSLEREVGRENMIYVLVTYLPIPSHIEEMKTKPTQTSVRLLEENGIHPDFILCRGKSPLDAIRKKKIEVYSNISSDYIISMPDVTGPNTVNTIYTVPKELEKEQIGRKILSKMKLEKLKEPDWSDWNKIVDKIINPEQIVKIAIVGKYLDIGDFQLKDSYISINESLKHAGAHNNAKVEITWIDSKKLEDGNANLERLRDFKGVIVPGGFGNSGVEGKIKAINFCRLNNIPYLGLCYGLQLAVVEFARNVCNLDADTIENDPSTLNPVIDILPEQKSLVDKGGTMRLGAYRAILKEDSRVRQFYGTDAVYERHRHRYEVNPNYHDLLERNGLVFSGTSEDKRLVEFIELPKEKHKFFIATQAHPEFKSSLLKPAPLFYEFIKSTIEN